MFSSLSSKVLKNLCNYKNVFPDVRGSGILITLGHINTRFSRKLSLSSPVLVRTLRYLGQPTSQTHPHLVRPGEVTAGIQQEEFRRRRGQLMSAVKEHHGKQSRHVVIIVSSPVKYMAVDVPYPFRQDPNFLYLSGFKEPNSVLVLESCPGDSPTNHRATLLVPERNPERELWDGPRSGTDGALQLTGVDQTLKIDDLGRFLVQFRTQDWTVWFDHLKPVHRQLCEQIKTSLLQPRTLESKAPTQQVSRFVQQLRLVKSYSEVALMKKASDITAQAFTEAMRFSFPGVSEAQLQGKLDYECRMDGADMLAYPPVVAGGNRANTLHYISNNQVINDGELVLVDAGCEYHGYVCDITRTWPISGKFTEPQRQLYEAVLSIQKTCLNLCRPEISLDHIYTVMLNLIGMKLKDLGIVRDKEGHELTQPGRYCPHHISHYLGMDVHDTPDMSRSSKLAGIYVKEDDQSAPPEFRGIGIRIEDDVLITDGDPQILTRNCPKEVHEIEQLMA
ncbi:xaa-Pro aminopeptidase 3-like [Branchiostoma floridae]|uniref:Xaa-Pro aminopeptidase 3-like n=1 Tax=Branchiostoma floridae TaxID=7739 RepID=A0A9J7LEV9_BRAFL|nr:xaa-Pro aminopeptidase 3-like [Branchiostoma floridae]